jgi:hypothetical protein
MLEALRAGAAGKAQRGRRGRGPTDDAGAQAVTDIVVILIAVR